MAETTQMSYEELVGIFGEETAKQMFAQMNASTGGNRAPFPFLKPISKHTSPVGKFGDFVFGVEQEKGSDGEYTITDNGTNLETSFEFLIVNVSYRYKRYVEAEEKTYRTNIFETLDGCKSAVDIYSGRPLPVSKEEKKAMDWKLVRINSGLVRKNSKSKWTPVIFETHGSLYYSLGEVINGQANNGLLSGVVKIQTAQREKGSTLYSVIDAEKSSFGPLPKDLFSKEETKGMLGDITKKMTEYRKGAQFSGAAAATPLEGAAEGGAEGAPADGAADGDNW